MSITVGILFPALFLDFTKAQLGWDRDRGVTRPENLRPESDIKEVLIARSGLRNICVQVVSEESVVHGIKLLKLSDAYYSIYALIWQHTQGCDIDSLLVNKIIELHDFDVSARHTPLIDSDQQVHLQFSLTIHRLTTHQRLEVSSREPVAVRDRANVKSLLREFKAWAAASDASISDDLSRQTRTIAIGPKLEPMDIATQLPLSSRVAADDTQMTAASETLKTLPSQDSLRATSKDMKPQGQQPNKHSVEMANKLAHLRSSYDGDEDWADIVNQGRTVHQPRFSKAQEKHLRWAPAPGTEAEEPSLPKKDLLLMSEYVDNAEDYIDLLQANDNTVTSSTTQSSHETQADVIAYAQRLRHRPNSPDTESISNSEWPPSDPVQPSDANEDSTNMQPLSQMGDLDEQSNDDEASTRNELPADTDDDDQRVHDQASTKEATAAVRTSKSPSAGSSGDRTSTDREFAAKSSGRCDTLVGLSTGPFATSKPLPEDIHELEKLLESSRQSSPRHAQIYRALSAAKQQHASEDIICASNTSPLSDRSAADTRTPRTTEHDDVHTSPSSQLHHQKQTRYLSTLLADFQVGRTPFANSNRLPALSSPNTVVRNTARPQELTTSSPFSRMHGKLSNSAGSASKHSPLGTTATPPSKRKPTDEQQHASESKKPRFYKPQTETFDLSQELQEHAGASYNFEKLRASHFGWAGQEVTAPQQDSPSDKTPQDPSVSDGEERGQAMQIDTETQSDSLSARNGPLLRPTKPGTLDSAKLRASSHTSREHYTTPIAPQTSTPRTDQAEEARDVFTRFKNAYPSWSGDFTHFLNICQMLLTAKAMLAFYDDFVVMYKEGYRFYVLNCVDNDRPNLPYEEWFRRNVKAVKYSAGILNDESLQRVLHNATVLASAPSAVRTESSLPSQRNSDRRPFPTMPPSENQPPADATSLSVTNPANTASGNEWSGRGSKRRSLPWTDGTTSTTAIELDDENDDNWKDSINHTPSRAQITSGSFSASKAQARAMPTDSPASVITTIGDRDGKPKRLLILPPELSAADKALLAKRSARSTKPSAFRKFRKSGPV